MILIIEKSSYKIGRGQKGVLVCEPYKSEIGKHWRFKTPNVAQKSTETIAGVYQILIRGDFIV